MFQSNLITRFALITVVLAGLAILPACGGGNSASQTATRGNSSETAENSGSGAASTAIRESDSAMAPAPKPAETSDSEDVAFVSGNVSYPSSGLTSPKSAPGDKPLEGINNFDIVNVPKTDLYVYTVDDTDFSDPVAGPIKTDANGNYTIMLSNFKPGFDPYSQQQYVIRAASDNGPGQKLDVRR